MVNVSKSWKNVFVFVGTLKGLDIWVLCWACPRIGAAQGAKTAQQCFVRVLSGHIPDHIYCHSAKTCKSTFKQDLASIFAACHSEWGEHRWTLLNGRSKAHSPSTCCWYFMTSKIWDRVAGPSNRHLKFTSEDLRIERLLFFFFGAHLPQTLQKNTTFQESKGLDRTWIFQKTCHDLQLQ